MIPLAAFGHVVFAIALKHDATITGAMTAFALGAFFGYFGLLVFLEFYETQRPKGETEVRRAFWKVMNRCALWGAFVVGLIALASYLNG